jgi:hypothetical protein
MTQNEKTSVGLTTHSKETKLEAARGYSAPRLVVLGQAFHLVQGTDYTKMTQERNGKFYD